MEAVERAVALVVQVLLVLGLYSNRLECPLLLTSALKLLQIPPEYAATHELNANRRKWTIIYYFTTIFGNKTLLLKSLILNVWWGKMVRQTTEKKKSLNVRLIHWSCLKCQIKCMWNKWQIDQMPYCSCCCCYRYYDYYYYFYFSSDAQKLNQIKLWPGIEWRPVICWSQLVFSMLQTHSPLNSSHWCYYWP